MSVRFQDVRYGVLVGGDDGEEAISRVRGDSVSRGVVGEDRVDDGCMIGDRASDEVLPSGGYGFEDGVDYRFEEGGGSSGHL